jgi:glycosyltransferase involved in cell wall biosynthesis
VEGIDLTVYYFTQHTLKGVDRQFGKEIEWDIPLLEGYKYQFLKNYSPKPAVSGAFWGLINPQVFLILLKNRPDYIVVHGWAYLSNLILLLSAKLLGIKVLMRAESPWKQERRSKLKSIILNYFVTKALYIGNQNKEFYLKYGLHDDQLYFAPYCVDNQRFESRYKELYPDRSNIRKQMGYNKKDIIILFTGKYIPKKRPLDLLEAFNKIDNQDAKLLLVGEGELREEMEDFIESNKIDSKVILTGFINQSELPRYYAIADIFVLPSGKGETWGLVLNEAMNFQLPLVVSDMVGSSDDLVKEGANGFTYPCGDIVALTEKLNALVQNVNLRKKMGDASSVLVKNYSYRQVIEGILKAIA